MSTQNLPKLIVILGPTASGKTKLSIRLAKKLNGEIISADSRQIYKEMDIGTAKPSRKEIKKIPHHLIDIVWPDQEFNVAIYKKMAIKAIKNIQKRKKLPLLVGGTGLYIQAIVDNIEFPEIPPQAKLRKKLEKKTKKELFKTYKKLDPEGAEIIDKENKRRLIRAIEVCEVTGKSFWKQRKKGKPFFDILKIGIKLPKTELKKRVEKRVEKMFKLGLEKEVKNLVKKYGRGLPSLQAIGYQEWFSFAKASEDKKRRTFFSLTKNEKEEVKKLISCHTIQFAKRQMTWFKKHPAPEQVRCGASKRIHWVRNYRKAEKLIKKFLRK
ncbi:tRNA (adenosine(37)-N6)-dimethylallyltransferase MiaA [Patescibacteria group bacterium]|nr:tRNA (adenosine(37)-N6)-dimethylallyltransferase MiaA [Patescibacteria group bacterium]